MGPALVAFAVATLLTGVVVAVTNFPRTFRLLLPRSWAFWLYCAGYGAFAAGVSLTEQSGIVGISGVAFSNRYAKAFSAGLLVAVAARPLIQQFKLTATFGSRAIPLRLGNVVGSVDSWALGQIALDHHRAVRSYIGPRAERYPDLAEVRARIREHAPAWVPQVDIAAFLQDIEDDRVVNTVTGAMEQFIHRFGKANFDMAFPIPSRREARKGRSGEQVPASDG